MAKKYKLNKIKTKRSYSFKEIATLIGIHIRTVQSWRKEGLETLEGTKSPYLVMGYQLKGFLKTKQAKRRTKLKDAECYCLVCREGVVPTDIRSEDNGIIGGNKRSIILKGVCPKCKRTVNRFVSKESKT